MSVDTTPLAIDLHSVRKTYGRNVVALRDVTMQVRRGEIFGLLGPNGAGKSTLVKIMMTVVRPQTASGTILAKPIGHKPTLARVGYLPENHRFPKYLTGRQVVELMGRLSNLSRKEARQRAAPLLDMVGMTGWADQRITRYSKGMMQRVGLAQALVADPDLVVLDEPTDGVDPGGRRDIRDCLQEMRRRGKTVFINSHLLSELELICDRVAILVQGAVARQGTIDDLTRSRQYYEIEIKREAPLDRNAAMKFGIILDNQIPPLPTSSLSHSSPTSPDIKIRGSLPGGQWCEIDGLTIRVGSIDPADIQPMLDAIRTSGALLSRISVYRPSLEELFMEAVSEVSGDIHPRMAVGAL